ncbi:hypothetical protein C8Q80DRAFT_1273402 [Daedaleopsis nitida]|nr:hypothetical protein C8Q80DRAFT_1273402 [Daedaleopsis nitida]
MVAIELKDNPGALDKSVSTPYRNTSSVPAIPPNDTPASATQTPALASAAPASTLAPASVAPAPTLAPAPTPAPAPAPASVDPNIPPVAPAGSTPPRVGSLNSASVKHGSAETDDNAETRAAKRAHTSTPVP